MTTKYRTEMWDTVHYFFSDYNDHMMHARFELETKLDVERFKKAFMQTVEIFPIFACTYQPRFTRAKWVKQNFTVDDMVQVIEGKSEAEQMVFLTRVIDETKEPQVKIGLFRGEDSDTICMLINHQVFDGAGFKEFSSLLSRIYENLATNPEYRDAFTSGSRKFSQLYKNFTAKQKVESALLFNYGKKNTEKVGFPYEKSIYQNARIMMQDYSAEQYSAIRAFAKKNGFTTNDVIMTIYSRALARLINEADGANLEIDCICDLRRYLESKKTDGLTNFVAKIICNTENNPEESLYDACKAVNASMAEAKKHYPGLNGLSLLQLGYGVLPMPVARLVMRKVFNNPLVALSNIGVFDDKQLVFDGKAVKSVFMTGSIKFAPYFQLSCTSYKNTLSCAVALYGTARDEENVRTMYSYMTAEIDSLVGLFQKQAEEAAKAA